MVVPSKGMAEIDSMRPRLVLRDGVWLAASNLAPDSIWQRVSITTPADWHTLGCSPRNQTGHGVGRQCAYGDIRECHPWPHKRGIAFQPQHGLGLPNGKLKGGKQPLLINMQLVKMRLG